MGKNSKGGIKQRKAYHQADVAKEAAEEAKRAAKLAKKQENMKAVAEQEQESLLAASMAQAAPAGGSMDVDRPGMSHKQKIGPKSKLGVRKGQGAIKKPNRMMRKSLKKLEKKREMEF
eukprot:3198618-Prymnesium_polylepis.2